MTYVRPSPASRQQHQTTAAVRMVLAVIDFASGRSDVPAAGQRERAPRLLRRPHQWSRVAQETARRNRRSSLYGRRSCDVTHCLR